MMMSLFGRATKGMSEIMEERRRRGLKQHQPDPATGQAVSDTRYQYIFQPMLKSLDAL